MRGRRLTIRGCRRGGLTVREVPLRLLPQADEHSAIEGLFVNLEADVAHPHPERPGGRGRACRDCEAGILRRFGALELERADIMRTTRRVP